MHTHSNFGLLPSMADSRFLFFCVCFFFLGPRPPPTLSQAQKSAWTEQVVSAVSPTHATASASASASASTYVAPTVGQAALTGLVRVIAPVAATPRSQKAFDTPFFLSPVCCDFVVPPPPLALSCVGT